MRNEVEKLYVQKQIAWMKQTELSITDSNIRIDFLNKQNDINNQLIEVNKQQLHWDTEMLEKSRKEFNQWLADNPE